MIVLRQLLFISLVNLLDAQFLGSSLYNALSGYGESDMCRYISCPFGQYCWNGNCISTGGLSGRGMSGMGALTSAAAMYGGMGPMSRGGVPGLPPSAAMGAAGNYGNLGLGLGMTQYGVAQSNTGGMMPCSLMQQCLNGQICVNGYCSRSNVAFSGSQLLPPQTTCAMGAVCPVGQYCIAGFCIQNTMSSTFACQNGISCPMGMMCQFGRCINNGLPPGGFMGMPGGPMGGPLYGKKK